MCLETDKGASSGQSNRQGTLNSMSNLIKLIFLTLATSIGNHHMKQASFRNCPQLVWDATWMGPIMGCRLDALTLVESIHALVIAVVTCREVPEH